MKPVWLQSVLSYSHEALLAALLAGLFIAAARVDPAFITARTQTGLYTQMWDVALLALPMTFIIITGGIDLSVGAIMSLASVTMGMLYAHHHWPLTAASLAAVAIGLLCGLLNGFFVTRVKVHPLIVTLATMSAFRGLAEGISMPDTYALPDALYGLAKRAVDWHAGSWHGLPLPGFYPIPGRRDPPLPFYALQISGWLFVASAIVTAIVLAFSRFGRTLYAIGHNETAAHYSGLAVNRVKMTIYAFSGLMAGVVAVNVSAGQNTAKADVGVSMELDVITAVVLGGTSIFGGRGRIIGTVLGVVLIHETRQFVKWHYNKEEWVSVVLGGLLIVAVAANALLTHKRIRGSA